MGKGKKSTGDELLRLFKRRADQILSTPIAQRNDALTMGRNFHVNIALKDGATTDLRFSAPSRHEIDLAVSYLRPLMLESDNLYAVRVIDELIKHCPEDQPGIKLHLDKLRAQWESGGLRRFKVMIQEDGKDDMDVDMWDSDIANRHTYVDVVHGDPDADQLDDIGAEMVDFAASAQVSDAMRLVGQMYEVLHGTRPDIAPGHSPLLQKALDEGLDHVGGLPLKQMDTTADAETEST